MKNAIIVVTVVLIIVELANCGIQTIPNASNKDHPGKCFVAGNPPIILGPGDQKTTGACERITCDRKLNVEIHSCNTITETKECKKVDGAGKRPYPECCPRMKC